MIPRRTDPRLYIVMGGVGIVVAAGLLFVQWNNVSEERGKIEQLQGEVRAQKDVPAQLAESKIEVAKVRSELAHLEKNVPDFAYVPTMLRELEAAGKASGLEVIGVRPMPRVDNPKDAKAERKPYESVDIEVRGRGGYGAVLRFIQALKAFPKIVAARGVSVEPKPDPLHPKAAMKLEMSVRLRAFIFAEARDQAPVDEDAALDKTAMRDGDVAHAG